MSLPGCAFPWISRGFRATADGKSDILSWRSQKQSRRLTADDADFTDGQNPLRLRNRN